MLEVCLELRRKGLSLDAASPKLPRAAGIPCSGPPGEIWVTRHPPVLGLVRALAASSYGIYLLHPLVLDVLGSGVLGFRISGTSLPPFIGIPALALGLLFVSLGVMTVARRIPILGRLLGAA